MVLTVEMQRYGQTFASGHAPPWNSLFGQVVLVKDGWPPSPSWRSGTVVSQEFPMVLTVQVRRLYQDMPLPGCLSGQGMLSHGGR